MKKQIQKDKTEIIIGELNKNYFTHKISQSIIHNQEYINLFLTESSYKLKSKIENNSKLAKNLFEIKNGIKPYEVGKGKPAQTKEILQTKPYTSETRIDDSFTPLIGGSSFYKYQLLWNNDYWIKYGEWLAAPRSKDIFDAKEKLIFRQTSDKLIGMYITEGFIMRNNTHIILNKKEIDINLKYALSVFNSKLLNYYYQLINPEKGEALAEVKAFHLENLPIKEITLKEQNPFIKNADLMLSLYQELQEQSSKFQRTLQRKFEGLEINKKLESWYELTFAEFVKELGKKKIKLSLSEEAEWEDYFLQEQQKALALKQQITTTDQEIDKMVYELYGLTDEEIEIVENS